MIDKYFVSDIKRVRITTTDDGIGGVIETRNELVFEGRIRPLNGNERLSADKQTLYSTHRLYCNINVDITPKDEILYKDQYYNIVYINNPMNLDKFLQIDLELMPNV